MTLRVRNDDFSQSSSFYAEYKDPTLDLIKETIANPVTENGFCLVGDVSFYWGDRDSTPFLRLYLGIPNRIIVMLQSPPSTWCKIGNGNEEVCFLCPDITPDLWWKIPQNLSVEEDELLVIIQEFVKLEDQTLGLEYEKTMSKINNWLDGSWVEMDTKHELDILEDEIS